MIIRPASFDDSDFVWRLSNRPSVREVSTRNAAFTYEEHLAWWSRRFFEGNTRFWIATVESGENRQGCPVGYVRYTRALEGQPQWSGGPSALMDLPAEVSIAISPDHRRKGYARLLLENTLPLAVGELGGESVRALILNHNRESIALFRSCGFDYLGQELRMGKDHSVYFWRAPYWEYEERDWPV